MSCNFKTALASLRAHPECFYILRVVYSDTDSGNHTSCCHNDRLHSVMAKHLSVSNDEYEQTLVYRIKRGKIRTQNMIKTKETFAAALCHDFDR